ncbi:glycosyltransferase [Halosimplex marinum]|uniref:glycosyltransferase n=1 Tax=Halosimplex marinum TaxID=3396620 RepID=UPI003F558B38
MSTPTVSVVLPTYDRCETIGRAVRSVLEQTVEDLELIVVDGGSTDGTERVVGEIDDDRLRFVREPDDGPSEARNRGIDLASGAYIAFQDSDDVWEPSKLEKQLDRFEAGGADVGVVYTAFRRELRDGTEQYVPRTDEVGRTSGDIHRQLLEMNLVTASTALVRRECFRELGGFDETLPSMEDWELWIRLSEEYEFAFVDEPLVRMATLDDSLSRDVAKNATGLRRVLRKHRRKFRDNDPERLARLYWRLAELELKASEPARTVRSVGRSLLAYGHSAREKVTG